MENWLKDKVRGRRTLSEVIAEWNRDLNGDNGEFVITDSGMERAMREELLVKYSGMSLSELKAELEKVRDLSGPSGLETSSGVIAEAMTNWKNGVLQDLIEEKRKK